jgi:hypothetical protein
MDDGRTNRRQMRSALFVDFDNIFGGLQDLDPAAARRFATNPSALVGWLEQGGDDWAGPFERRFLVKHCYLNPEVHRNYRSYFASAGFRVVDCPSLTRQGKSAADIHLVLDVVDSLDHQTRFDEYIICSADADFTPLMARIRSHDRRTVMIAAGPSSSAYQAVCDQALTAIELVEALDGTSPARPRTEKVAREDEVATAHSIPAASDLVAAADAVRKAVSEAGGAIGGAAAASAARLAVPEIAADRWGGSGFSGFLAVHAKDLQLVPTDSGGVVLDPAVKSPAQVLAELGQDDLPGRVSRVTKVPRLASSQYAAMFRELARLSADPPSLSQIGIDVREAAAARGHSVPRSATNFVLQGLIYAGADPRRGPRRAEELAQVWRDNVLALCERSGLELEGEDLSELDRWLLADLQIENGEPVVQGKRLAD